MKKALLPFLFCAASTVIAQNMNIGLTELHLPKAVVVGREIPVTGVIVNKSAETLTRFDLLFDNGSALVSTTIDNINVPAGESYTFTAPENFIARNPDAYTVWANISAPNGKTDADPSDNSISAKVNGLLYDAVKRTVAEEATGTWCGWCPRGAVYMASSKEDYPDTFIGIAVHNSDPMTVPIYDGALTDYIGGFPTVLLDRFLTIDPSELPSKIPSQLDDDPVASMGIYGTYDDVTRQLSIDITASFLTNHDDINYRLNAVLVEDDVTGISSGYSQANYYAGGGSGAMGGFEDLSNPVPAGQMHYEFVARTIADGWEGTPESVPVSVSAGELVIQHYEFTLASAWDPDFISIVGLLTDHDNIKDRILNGYEVKLSDLTEFTGIHDHPFVSSLNIYPNPVSDNMTINLDLADTKDIAVRMTDMNGQTVYQHVSNNQSGMVEISVDTKSFAAGIYTVTITAGNEFMSRKISVMH